MRFSRAGPAFRIADGRDLFFREGTWVIRCTRARAADKTLEVRIDLPSQLADRVLLGDPTRLGQILVNLCGNSVKFTDSGSITLRCRSTNEDEWIG